MRTLVVAMVGASGLLACSTPPPPSAADTPCTAPSDCPVGLECVASACTVPGAYAAAELARVAAAREGELAARSAELARLTALHATLVANQRPLELEKQRIDARLRMATGEERQRLSSELFALDVRLEALEDASEVGSIARKDRLEHELQAIKAAVAGELRGEEHIRLTDRHHRLERDLAALASAAE